ncbi:hypothetical protein, partial [Paraburkholderia sp. SIMBA_030]|uniref:hypothetical protein n=1 Tax=Paraburkholderia sp. SIMBA_030 TaxID=3085773 RepID=UPI00397B9941
IGCGEGYYTQAMAQMGSDVIDTLIAADISKPAVVERIGFDTRSIGHDIAGIRSNICRIGRDIGCISGNALCVNLHIFTNFNRTLS